MLTYSRAQTTFAPSPIAEAAQARPSHIRALPPLGLGGVDLAELLVALEEGRVAMRPTAAGPARRAYLVERVASPRPLGPREREALRLVGRGLANKEIAFELGVSVSSAGRALAGAARALGLPSRVDLAILSAALQGRGSPDVTRLVAGGGLHGQSPVLVVSLGRSVLWARLSPAERVVTELALAGQPGVAIASARGDRSPRTIANQLSRVFRKVGVSHRAELAARLVTCVE